MKNLPAKNPPISEPIQTTVAAPSPEGVASLVLIIFTSWAMKTTAGFSPEMWKEYLSNCLSLRSSAVQSHRNENVNPRLVVDESRDLSCNQEDEEYEKEGSKNLPYELWSQICYTRGIVVRPHHRVIYQVPSQQSQKGSEKLGCPVVEQLLDSVFFGFGPKASTKRDRWVEMGLGKRCAKAYRQVERKGYAQVVKWIRDFVLQGGDVLGTADPEGQHECPKQFEDKVPQSLVPSEQSCSSWLRTFLAFWWVVLHEDCRVCHESW